MANAPTILTFDSGLGGLTVFRELVRECPGARHVYLADDDAFPYGRIPEHILVERVLAVVRKAIACFSPALVVVACNTASTIVLPDLRARFDVPFVGTVPAIKPACAASLSKRVAVLGTEATVSREYTRALIRDYGQGCDVALIGSARLAGYAEDELRGEPAADPLIAAEIAPCFIDEGGRRTDSVVLACTHYPLLTPRFVGLAPWPVQWIDPAPAIARRVAGLLGPCPDEDTDRPPRRALFTSPRGPTLSLINALAGFGLAEVGRFDMPKLSA